MKKMKLTSLLITLIISMISVTVYASDFKYGTITASALNVRSEPNTSSNILGLLPNGAGIDLQEQVGNWYKISYNDKTGYISADYVSVSEKKSEQQISDLRTKIVETSKLYIGTPYLYGGSTPSGFDCSGFVKYVYEQCGLTLPRTSGDQYKIGTYVSRENLLPGDIVCFGSSDYINHVGIYVGNGLYIHSPRTGYTVSIVSIDGGYSSPFMYGRRIIN